MLHFMKKIGVISRHHIVRIVFIIVCVANFPQYPISYSRDSQTFLHLHWLLFGWCCGCLALLK